MTTLLHTHIEVPVFSVSGIFAVLADAVIDTLKTLPFLFVAFLVIEFLEHRAQDKIKHIFTRAGIAGPFIGTILGCIPQCGFSVMSANLYSSGIITLGTLIAVFLSTSDEAIILLATAPKSNSAICAIDDALADIEKGNCGEIPLHLKDAHYKGAAEMGRGVEYKYPHSYPNHYVDQQYLPDAIKDRNYYVPGENKFEHNSNEYWKKIKK